MNRFATPLLSKALSAGAWPPGGQNYAGWIPCVTGQLSFSMIGRLDGQVDANLAVDSDPPQRFIAVMQKRQTTDLPYFKWLVRLFRPWSVSTYLLVASTDRFDRRSSSGSECDIPDDIGVLKGTVFVFGHRRGYENRIMSRYRINGINKAILRSAKPRNALVQKSHADSLANSIERRIRSLKRRGIEPLEVEFVILRTGEVRISARALKLMRAVRKMPPTSRKKFVKSLIHQVYYFIKDASHNHYHHESDQDNILPLEKYSRRNDHHWRRQTLWSLTRAVLEKRRSTRLDWQKRALGVLAYADSFQKHVAGFKRDPNNFAQEVASKDVAAYDFDHAKQSLQSTHDVNHWRQTSFRWRSGVGVTVFLAMSAFLTNVYEVAGRQKLPDTWLTHLMQFAAEDPWYVVMASTVVFLIAADFFRVGFDEIKSKRSYWVAAVKSIAAGLARWLRSGSVLWSVHLAFAIQVLSVGCVVLSVAALLLKTLSLSNWSF